MPSDSKSHIPDNCSLQAYALLGNDVEVKSAVDLGADVNAFDASGRTGLMSAIAGKDWNDINFSHDASYMTASRLKTIKFLLDCHDISLFTLNAPQSSFNDATPLGMAAWLNMPEAVRVLLEGSSDAVSVDGMDTHGATPLMYAARDGGLEVVKLLLRHGARPDFRDSNHRSSIQYAVTHPEILYLCETALRRHRFRENETSPRSSIAHRSEALQDGALPSIVDVKFDEETISKTTHTLIQLVLSSDIQSLHSFLFPSSPSFSNPESPILVNLPDAKGWSPIHYCAQMQFPSIQIVDTLYCAGADFSLFTVEEHWTILHCLSKSYYPPDRTPNTIHSLSKFITHLIFDLRAPFSAKDKEDESCIHLAAEHGQSIELLKILLECDRTKSIRNRRNSRGLTAQEVSKPEFLAAFGVDLENDRPQSSLSMATIRPVTSMSSLSSSASSWKPPSPRRRRNTTSSDSDSIVCCDDFDIIAAAHQLIDNLRITSPHIHHSIAFSHLEHLENVMRETEQLHADIIRSFRNRTKGNSKALEDMNTDAVNISRLLKDVTSAVSNKLIDHGLPPIHQQKAVRQSEDSQITAVSIPSLVSSVSPPTIPTPSALTVDTKVVTSSSPKSPKSPKDEKFSKFMGWLKGKKSKDFLKETKEKETKDIVTGTSLQTNEVPQPVLQTTSDPVVDKALLTSRFVLAAAARDMSVIHESLDSARELMKSASRSIARADRIIKGAIKSRNTLLEDLRASGRKDAEGLFVNGTPGALGYPNYLAQKPSIQSIDSVSTTYSVASNNSFSNIIADNDDEEVKAIRRLVLRKIEARHDGALDEMDKVVGWLRIIKETVRGVKRRTYCN